MLLIGDHQPQMLILHALGNQRMGADYRLPAAGCDLLQRLPPVFGLHAAQ